MVCCVRSNGSRAAEIAPVIIKEVGFGLSDTVARQLIDAGVYAIDIAGAGGTNWATVEAERAGDLQDAAVAEAFKDWGIPTATALTLARRACPDARVIASGGIRDGVEIVPKQSDLAGTLLELLPVCCRQQASGLTNYRTAWTCIFANSEFVASPPAAAI